MEGNTAVDHAEIGQPESRTRYSDYADRYYAKARAGATSLSASEYVAVVEGFLREFVCMGQCNLYIAAAKDPQIKEAIGVYLRDVCYPNLREMKKILEDDGYRLPAPYNAVSDAKSLEQLGQLRTDAIDDRMILVGHIFAVEGFMNRWNQGSALSHKADVRDAFVRNWHRANRWHLAALAMAEQMRLLEPQPSVRA